VSADFDFVRNAIKAVTKLMGKINWQIEYSKMSFGKPADHLGGKRMGKTKGYYNAEFPSGTKVRIAARKELEQFLEEWKYHHPLEQSQIAYAGEVAEVETVAFYHGGDELYTLKGIPGTWHESCIQRTD
jgi:hypothetical protein